MNVQAERSLRDLAIAERRALRDHVREAITNAILDGEFQPGERIVETRVARELGVSQTTVREALVEIEQLGIISSRPHRGVFVRPITSRDVVEMYEMRALLEGHAARLVALSLADDDLSELEGLLEEMVQSAAAGDVRAMIRKDVEFHSTVCRLAGGHLLARLWSAVNPHLWTFVAVRGLLGLEPQLVARRHSKIVEALRSRDADRAEAATRSHMMELRDIALLKLKETGVINR